MPRDTILQTSQDFSDCFYNMSLRAENQSTSLYGYEAFAVPTMTQIANDYGFLSSIAVEKSQLQGISDYVLTNVSLSDLNASINDLLICEPETTHRPRYSPDTNNIEYDILNCNAEAVSYQIRLSDAHEISSVVNVDPNSEAVLELSSVSDSLANATGYFEIEIIALPNGIFQVGSSKVDTVDSINSDCNYIWDNSTCSEFCEKDVNYTVVETKRGYYGELCPLGDLSFTTTEKCPSGDGFCLDCQGYYKSSFGQCDEFCLKHREFIIDQEASVGGYQCSNYLPISAACTDGGCRCTGIWSNLTICSENCEAFSYFSVSFDEIAPSMHEECSLLNGTSISEPCTGGYCMECEIEFLPTFSSCSENCTQVQDYAIVVDPSPGQSCDLTGQKTRECSGDLCKDCQYEIEWSFCNEDCRQDSTFLITQNASLGGQPCPELIPESRACILGACTEPVDCEATLATSDCFSNCTRKNTYEIVQPALFGGQACEYPDQFEFYTSCSSDECALPCIGGFSDWICDSVTCIESRVYSIDANPESCPYLDGFSQSRPCENCEIDCTGEWTKYSECNSHCTRSRQFIANNPDCTDHLLSESELCQSDACSPKAWIEVQSIQGKMEIEYTSSFWFSNLASSYNLLNEKSECAISQQPFTDYSLEVQNRTKHVILSIDVDGTSIALNFTSEGQSFVQMCSFLSYDDTTFEIATDAGTICMTLDLQSYTASFANDFRCSVEQESSSCMVYSEKILLKPAYSRDSNMFAINNTGGFAFTLFVLLIVVIAPWIGLFWKMRKAEGKPWSELSQSIVFCSIYHQSENQQPVENETDRRSILKDVREVVENIGHLNKEDLEYKRTHAVTEETELSSLSEDLNESYQSSNLDGPDDTSSFVCSLCGSPAKKKCISCPKSSSLFCSKSVCWSWIHDPNQALQSHKFEGIN